MSYIVFLVVLTAACVLISNTPFIKNSGLGTKFILVLFLLKIFIGLLHGYITQLYFPGSDTWGLNDGSVIEYEILKNDPSRFFRELYASNYSGKGYGNLFGSFGSFWNDLELNLITKALAPFNFISKGNYYVNSIFFNFFGFFGHIALFRLFHHIYKNKKNSVLIGCFFLPSFMFFSSAIGKDNIAFTMLAMFCFALYFFTLHGFNAKRLFWLLLFFFGVLLMRNHIALLLIPPAVAFYITAKTRKNPLVIFCFSFVVLIGLLFILPHIIPSADPGIIISQKQKDFLSLGIANTQIPVTPLEPSLTGLIQNFPEAFMHGFFRPYITEIKKFFTAFLSIEILCLVLLFVVATYLSIKKTVFQQPDAFTLFCIMFCCMVFIMNGYIVPNSNTLVRYRSIYLPLIMTPIICNIGFKKTH